MGLRVARTRPDDEDATLTHPFGRQHRLIGGIEAVAVTPDPMLRPFDLRRSEAGRRQHGVPVAFRDPDDDIASVQIVKVVRESADRLQDLRSRGPRIPRRLELHSLGLDRPAMQQAVEIDRQDGAHAGIIATSRARCTVEPSRPWAARAGLGGSGTESRRSRALSGRGPTGSMAIFRAKGIRSGGEGAEPKIEAVPEVGDHHLRGRRLAHGDRQLFGLVQRCARVGIIEGCEDPDREAAEQVFVAGLLHYER